MHSALLFFCTGETCFVIQVVNSIGRWAYMHALSTLRLACDAYERFRFSYKLLTGRTFLHILCPLLVLFRLSLDADSQLKIVDTDSAFPCRPTIKAHLALPIDNPFSHWIGVRLKNTCVYGFRFVIPLFSIWFSQNAGFRSEFALRNI